MDGNVNMNGGEEPKSSALRVRSVSALHVFLLLFSMWVQSCSFAC